MSGNVSKNPISRIVSNGWFISFLLGAAVILGVVAGGYFSSSLAGDGTAFPIEQSCVYMFLAATVLLAIHVIFQICEERAALGKSFPPLPPLSIHGSPTTQRPILYIGRDLPSGKSSKGTGVIYIPCLIVILVLIHGIYRTVSISDNVRQNDAIRYTLGALPELLAVFLFAIPGLVPEEGNQAPRPHEHGKDPEAGSDKAKGGS